MTIATENSSIIVSCNGSQQSFSFNFVGDSTSDITVSSISSAGTITVLSATTYSISLNAAAPNQLWSVGGTVTMNTAPASGTSLLIQRTLPLTQETSIQNQGNIYPQVIEEAMDTLEMQIQQIAGRTTQFQGQWVTGTIYTVGDIVQDGANGANTLSYYICQVGNTSGVWATDLASGYWAISVVAIIPSSNQPITLSGAVTGTGTQAITTTLQPLPNNIVTTSSIITNAVTFSKLAEIGANTIVCNPSAVSAIPSIVALNSSTILGMGSSGNITALTAGSGISIGVASIAVSLPSAATNSLAGYNSSGVFSDVSIGSNLSLIGGILNATSGQIMTPLAVGSIILAQGGNNVQFTAGTPVAASGLTTVTFQYSSNPPNLTTSGDSLTGTWKPLESSPGPTFNALLFQRTA